MQTILSGRAFLEHKWSTWPQVAETKLANLTKPTWKRNNPGPNLEMQRFCSFISLLEQLVTWSMIKVKFS